MYIFLYTKSKAIQCVYVLHIISLSLSIYVYMYIYVHICIYTIIYTYIALPCFCRQLSAKYTFICTILYLSANYLHCQQLPARARQAHSSAAIWKYCRHMNLYIYIDIYVDRYNDLMYIYNDMIWIHKLPTAARKSRAMRCT